MLWNGRGPGLASTASAPRSPLNPEQACGSGYTILDNGIDRVYGTATFGIPPREEALSMANITKNHPCSEMQ